MGSSFSRFYILFLVVISTVHVNAQDVAIKTKLEQVSIKKDSSFVNQVTVTLKKSDDVIVYPIFYDTELEKIENIQVFTKKGKRFKLVKEIILHEEDLKLEYIASKKIKMIAIPYKTETKITYTLKCDELMYFSGLRFFSNDDIDTLKYQISVPKTFDFIHNTINKDSLKYFALDSLQLDTSTTWNINVIPKKVKPNPLTAFGIYKNIKEPLMRTLVLPKDYNGDGKKYMNDWYLKKTATRKGLSDIALQKIDEITKGITDPKEITAILYKYVHTNFKYVAIEIGMGAFIPTHVNEVFTNKQGDCKDLSNFLSEALNYKGIKSDIALAATSQHISDCDFPSLSSADHVVCLAYINEKAIVLDPTDPIHYMNTPVESIQERSVLIINNEGGEFYQIPTFLPSQNAINYNITLKENSDKELMQGNFSVNYGGISGNYLKRMQSYAGTKKALSVGIKHYESVFGNQSISDLKINNQTKEITSEGSITVNGKIIKDGENRFLFIDFLPRIFESEERETLLDGTHIGSSFHKKINLEIQMDDPIEMFNTIKHSFSENGISLNLEISSSSENKIKCTYDFIFDHIFINQENKVNTNKILTSFKKIINEPIVFRKKTE